VNLFVKESQWLNIFSVQTGFCLIIIYWLDGPVWAQAFLRICTSFRPAPLSSDFATNDFFLGWVVNPTPTPSNPGGSVFLCQGFLP
jgi:hypothetical protein